MIPSRSYETILAEAEAKAAKGEEAIDAGILASEAAAKEAIAAVEKKKEESIDAVNKQEAQVKQEKKVAKASLKALTKEEEAINKSTTKGLFTKEKVPLTETAKARLVAIQREKRKLEDTLTKVNQANYTKEIKAIEAKAKHDIAKIKEDLETQKAMLKGGLDIVLPGLYKAIHLGMEAGKSLSAIASNPVDSFRAAAGGKKLRALLKGEVGKVGKNKINEIITSKTVKSLLENPDLWQVIGSHSKAIPGIVESRKDNIGEAIRKALEEKGGSKKRAAGAEAEVSVPLTNASKLHAVGLILNSPHAIAAIIKIATDKPNQQALINLISGPHASKVLPALFARQGIDTKALQNLIPGILDILKVIEPNRQELVDILEIVAPTISDPTKPLDINALLPHVSALLFGNNGIAAVVGDFLANNKDAILKLGEFAITSQTNMLQFARSIKSNQAAILGLINAPTIDDSAVGRIATQAKLDPIILKSMIIRFKSDPEAVLALGTDKSMAALENRVGLIRNALVVGQDILPIVAKFMHNNNNPHFTKIMGALPGLIAVYKPNPDISPDENKKAAAAFNAAKMPIVMGLIPDLKELLFGQDRGIASDIAKMLEKDQPLLLQMAKFAEASQTGTTKFAALLEDILPIASKVMKNQVTLGKIMDTVPDLIKVYQPNPDISPDENKKAAAAFNAAKVAMIIKLIPDLRGMLFAQDRGIAGNVVSMLATKKDVLMELGKAVKASQVKKREKLWNPKEIAAINAQIKTTDMLLGMGDALLPLLSKNLLPSLLPIVDKVMQNNETISKVVTIFPTVMASGKPDPAALKELIKPVKELLFDQGIISDLASMLTKEKAAIVQMAGIAEASQTGTTKFAVLLEDILPIAAKVLNNQNAIGKIMDAVPELMAVYQPNANLDEAANKAAAVSFNVAKTQKIGKLFPDIKDIKNLLLGEQGVIKDLAKMLIARKDVLLEIGKTIKANQQKKLELADVGSKPGIEAQIKNTETLLGMADTFIPLVANNLLPVAERVLTQHDSEITQIIAALPAVMASGKPDPTALQGLITPVKQLLFGEHGITNEIVDGIEGNKDTLISLITSRVIDSAGVQKVLQGALATPQKVAVPEPMIANALTLTTTFLKHNKDGLSNILDIAQRVKINEKGKPEITRMQMGDVARELSGALQDKDIITSLEGFLTTENIQFLGKLPQLGQFNLTANAALIQDAGRRAINILPIASKFMQNNYGIIQKILQEQDNLANGVFKDTSITPKELVTIAQTGLIALMQFDPADLLSAHTKEVTSLIQSVAANALGGIKSPDLLAKIVVDSAAILLKPDLLMDLIGKVDNIALIIDDKTPRKVKLDKVFELTDIFVKQLKTKEFKDLYKDAAIPLIDANKAKVAEFFTKEARNNKINLDGNKVIGILKNPKTLETLMGAYEAYKQHSTLKAMGKGVKAFFQSKDLRSVVYRIVVDKIKDRTYPNFIRRWTVGSKINKIINETKPKIEIEPEGQDKAKPKALDKVNLAAKLAEKSTGPIGIYNSTLNTRTCKGLDFGQLKFDNFEIKGFNFKEASFGNKKEGVDFSGSTISKTNFEGCTLRGNKINLTNTTIDFQSFKSILPALNKAARNDKIEVVVKDMKIDVSKCSVKEMEEFEKMKTSRFGKKFLKDDSSIKLLTTKEHDVKDVKVEKTKAEAVKTEKGKGNPPSL